MPVSDFLPFATAPQANVATQYQWATDPLVPVGFVRGILPSAKTNKAIRQGSFMSAALGQVVLEILHQDVRDDGNLPYLTAQIKACITSLGTGAAGTAIVIISDTVPTQTVAGTLWWDSLDGQLYLYYNDGTSSQWVAASPSGGLNEAPVDGLTYGRINGAWSSVLPISGGSMTGSLILAHDPVLNLEAATKAYVDAKATTVLPSSTTPVMDGTAYVGALLTYARGDHIHPTDTSRAPLASPGFTGIPTAPTAPSGTATTQIASTQFVHDAILTVPSGVTTWNGRTGPVTLTLGDITAAGGATASQMGNYLPLTGGTLSGQLNVNASIQVNNPSGIGISAAAGNHAWLWLSPGGQHQWYIGAMNNSQLYITDQSVGAVRLVIDASGNTTVEQSLTVGGNQQINGSLNVSGNQISLTGSAPPIFMTANGVRAWYLQASSNGNFYFVDNSAGIVTAGIGNGNGQWTFNYPITVAGSGVCYSAWSGAHIGINWTGDIFNMHLMVDGAYKAQFYMLAPSDERVKENIAAPEGDSLVDIMRLKLRSFDYKLEYGGAHCRQGLIAQEVLEAIPEAVVPQSDDPEDRLSIQPTPLIFRCIGAIQQLADKIAALEDRIAKATT